MVSEWIIDVCEYFNLHISTIHAAISYLDRLQPSEKFTRPQWQMLAICCILIASKYNECEEHVPDFATLEEITQQPLANETVLSFELWALKKMAWQITTRTSISFLTCYLMSMEGLESIGACQAPGAECFGKSRTDLNIHLRKKIYTYSTKVLLDCRFKKYLCSDISIGVLLYARKVCDITPLWTDELTEIVQCDPFQSPKVEAIVSLMCELDGISTFENLVNIFTFAKNSATLCGDLVTNKDKIDNNISPISVAVSDINEGIVQTLADRDGMI